MILKFKIFSLVLFLTLTGKAQVSFFPNIDTSSTAITLLFNQKKFDSALLLLNKLIVDNPNNGENYFNRAVVKYHKQLKSPIQSSQYVVAKAIIRNCKNAIQLSYNNSEIYYLLFSEYYNCDPENSRIFGCSFDTTEEIVERFVQLKKLIDTAMIFSPNNEKYHWTRLQLFGNYRITSWPNFDLYKDDIPILRTDCEKLIELTKIKNRRFWAYYYLAEAYKTFYTDTSKAIQYYSAAIDIAPNHNNPYPERGKLRSSFNNDYEAAIEDFNIYLAKIKNADIFYERAFCYGLLDKYDEALKDLNSAILLYEEQRRNILDSSELASLERDFNSLKWGNTYSLRGLVNFHLKNEKAALKDFNKGIEYGSELALRTKADLFGDLNQNHDNKEDSQPTSNSITMTKKGGVYEIPVFINGSLKLNFIFDPGAADVSVSPDVALTLMRTGTVDDKDFIGEATYRFADGSIAKSKIFILKELQIGNKTVTNVKASISNSIDAPLLLGQSVLNKFGKVTIDYRNGVILFEE